MIAIAMPLRRIPRPPRLDFDVEEIYPSCALVIWGGGMSNDD